MVRVASLVVTIVTVMFSSSIVLAAEDSALDNGAHSKAFPILASTYVTLNILDVYTTTKAIGSGSAVEANPLIGSAAANPVALTALKAASTTTMIILARRLWKKHPAAAIMVLIGANAGMSFVVAHNAAVMSR